MKALKKVTDDIRMTSKDYERAVLEYFRTEWPEPHFNMRHNIRLQGSKTLKKRQIDVAIYAAGREKPFLLIEAKMHSRRIDVGVAGSTIAMVQDLGGMPTIMVSTSGFSIGASNHLEAESIGHFIITLKEAGAFRWIPTLERIFSIDREFKLVSGELVEALRQGNAEPFFDELVPYDEWLAIIRTGISAFPETTNDVLKKIASNHYDDGHRYNAISILSEAGWIDQSFLNLLINTETDPETVELLEEITSTIQEKQE